VNRFNILFVDDEIDFLETLMKRMKKRDVNASGVKSGREALIYLESNPTDAVVLDVRMPGMDGIETLRAIKEKYPLVEVIMLTGHASLEAARQGMELGAFDYLMKPINIDDLLYKIQDAHQKKTLQEQKIQHLKAVIQSHE
jgi:DNA-binding NtrC family response regulator